MKNEKGFTLVELMATIIILSIVLAVAIPSVSSLVSNSRKKAFYTDVSNIVQTVGSKAVVNNDSKCMYFYEYDKDKLPSNISALYIILRSTEDGYIYGVYAENSKNNISIDIDDFSKTSIDDFSTWKKDSWAAEGTASKYVTCLVEGFTNDVENESKCDDILTYNLCEKIG